MNFQIDNLFANYSCFLPPDPTSVRYFENIIRNFYLCPTRNKFDGDLINFCSAPLYHYNIVLSGTIYLFVNKQKLHVRVVGQFYMQIFH